MKRITENYKVETFETGVENFYMDVVKKKELYEIRDVVKKKELYEIWIYRENFEVKLLAISAKFSNLEEAVSFMEDHLTMHDWYNFYDVKYNG